LLAAALAPSSALAQSSGWSEPPALDPIRVGPAPIEIRVEDTIIVEAVSPTEAPGARDARSTDNPFGADPRDRAEPSPRDPLRDRGPAPRANYASEPPHRCAPSQRVYFDERSQLYRPCADTSGPSRAPSAVLRSGARSWRADAIAHCRAGGQSYFDERDQLYRPCPVAPSAADNRSTSPARPLDARYAAPAGVSTRCAPGARVYFDQREGLFRPCPSP